MAFKQKLTAFGPAAAYDALMSSADLSSTGIPDSLCGRRVRISSSQGVEWNRRANTDPNLGDTGENKSTDEPEAQSPYMR